MRAENQSSVPESRGDRTLMGIGPGSFARRESVSVGVAATGDNAPTLRMEGTPAQPVIVRPRSFRTAPVRTAQIPIDEAPVQRQPLRIDSLFSGRFFQEGDLQEANGWQDSPLALEPSPDEARVPFSSFDHIPRRRGPLIATTFIVGTALVIGLAIAGIGTGRAHAWLATGTGQRAVAVWNKAKSGLTVGLTPENAAASARAMAKPASAPAVPPVTAATVPSAAPIVPAASPRAPAVAEIQARAVPAAAPVAVRPRPIVEAVAERPVATASAAAEPKPVAASEGKQAEPAQHGVWSPSEQRVVPAQAADNAPPVNSERNVLPLDDHAHATY